MLKLFKCASNTDLLVEFLRTLLAGSPFEGHTFLVGGCVRDELLKRPVDDIDIVVDIRNGGLKIANYLGKKIDKRPVRYDRFGTAMLNFSDVKFKDHVFDESDKVEFVQTRKEKYDRMSRKPIKTMFGTIEQDAFRRDFTINALYKDLFTGEIKDVTGMGKKDLKNKVIRSTGDAADLFDEDPLRMLRAVRFAHQLKFKIDQSVMDGMKESADSLKKVSIERIMKEMNKILLVDEPDKALKLMRDVGLLDHVIPELKELSGLKFNPTYHHEDAFDHSLSVLRNTPPEILARLAGLLHDIGKARAEKWKEEHGIEDVDKHAELGEKMVREILFRLRYPSEVIDTVADVVAHHMWGISSTPRKSTTLDFISKIKSDINLLFSIMEADRIKSYENHKTPEYDKHVERMKAIRKHIDESKDVSLKAPIDGEDIMREFNMKPGIEVGRLKNMAEEYYHEHLDATKEEILQYLKTRKSACKTRLSLFVQGEWHV